MRMRSCSRCGCEVPAGIQRRSGCPVADAMARATSSLTTVPGPPHPNDRDLAFLESLAHAVHEGSIYPAGRVDPLRDHYFIVVPKEAGHLGCCSSEEIEEPRGQTAFLSQLRRGLAIGLEDACATESAKATEYVAASDPLSKGTGSERTEQLHTRSTTV